LVFVIAAKRASYVNSGRQSGRFGSVKMGRSSVGVFGGGPAAVDERTVVVCTLRGWVYGVREERTF